MKRRPWTSEDERHLRELYPHRRSADIAQIFGVSLNRIYKKAYQLGLKKSDEFFNSPQSGRTTGDRGASARFQKGHATWNKGTNFKAGGRAPETQFKKGNRPHTWVPIGTHRITKDGYLELKMTEVPGPSNKRWFPIHRLVWIEENGPIPHGHVIAFKPGMKTSVLEEITVDRLECISRRENARRNQPYSRGPEFGYLTRLNGAITRHVNRIAREHQEKQA